MKKLKRIFICIMVVLFCFSCKKQNGDFSVTQEENLSAAADIVLTQNTAEPENIENEEESVIEEAQMPEKEVFFDTSEPSVIPTDTSYFLDEKHITYLLYLENRNSGPSIVKPSLFFNPKSNVKYAKVEYIDFKNRILDDDNNLGRDHWDEYDNNILIDVYSFNNRKYAGTARFYEARNGKREPYFDYQTAIEYQDNDVLYNGNPEWKFIENKIQSSDNENWYYEILLNSVVVSRKDKYTVITIEYLFDGDFITVNKYNNGDLRQKLVYEKGILVSDWHKLIFNAGESIDIYELKYTCINGEGLYQQYNENGELTYETKLYRELDEDGFLKYQLIENKSGTATEWIFEKE